MNKTTQTTKLGDKITYLSTPAFGKGGMKYATVIAIEEATGNRKRILLDTGLAIYRAN